MTRFIAPLLLAAWVLTAPAIHADTLTIPGHVPSAHPLKMPSRGMKMKQVLASFGEPEARHGPVGDPPITTWDYGNFKVYFEYDTVLHSVDLTTVIMPSNSLSRR